MDTPNQTFNVDKENAVPIYTQLSNWLEAKVTTGEWPPNYRLPGEIELAKQLEVSRGTLRKAISQLIKKNLLVQIHGRGTFVSPFIVEQPWAGRLMGVYEELMLMGIPFTTEILEQKVVHNHPIEAENLGLDKRKPLLHLKRLRRADNEPLVLMESYLDASKFHELIDVDFSKESLMSTVENQYTMKLSWAALTISVVRSGAEMAEHLNINIGDPVLCSEHVIYDEQEQKVMISRQWFRSDRYRIRTTVHRGENEPFYSAITHKRTSQEPVKQAETSSSQKQDKRQLSLSELLPAERVKANVSVNSPEEAIQVVGRLMVESGAVEERYINGMINMAKQLGPYIVIAPGVAIPHARPEDGVITPCLALVTLDPPIAFGNPTNDPVKIVFAIGAVDAVQHIDALRKFANFLSDSNNLERLSNAKTEEEILSIMKVT